MVVSGLLPHHELSETPDVLNHWTLEGVLRCLWATICKGSLSVNGATAPNRVLDRALDRALNRTLNRALHRTLNCISVPNRALELSP